MALVARGAGAGYFLSVTLIDTQGDSSTKRFAMTSADNLTAVADAATILSALNGVTDSVVQSYSLQQIFDEDAFAYPTGADNSVKAVITYQLANKAQKGTEAIPAPSNDIFEQPSGVGNNIVDLVDPAVVAYVSMYQSGGECFLSDGDLSDFAIRGKRSTRR